MRTCFLPEVVCYWDLLGLLTFLCFSFSRQFEVGQVSGKIEFKYVEISLMPWLYNKSSFNSAWCCVRCSPQAQATFRGYVFRARYFTKSRAVGKLKVWSLSFAKESKMSQNQRCSTRSIYYVRVLIEVMEFSSVRQTVTSKLWQYDNTSRMDCMDSPIANSTETSHWGGSSLKFCSWGGCILQGSGGHEDVGKAWERCVKNRVLAWGRWKVTFMIHWCVLT